MKRFLLIFMLSFAASLLPAANALAHEPRYVKDDQLVIIRNSEISQAFYGELKSRPAYYLIDLKTAQELYFQIMAPVLPGIKKDKTVSVSYFSELGAKSEDFLKLEPASAVWKNFYEEYAGDDYWQGPEARKQAQAGYYLIKISSPDNTGKYVLAVGEKEEFSVPEMAKAAVIIPQIKTEFFNKPFWLSFQGKIGQYFGASVLILIVVGYLFRKFHQVYK